MAEPFGEILGLTPDARAKVANVCRQSSRRIFGTPAALTRRSKESLKFAGCSGSPVGVENNEIIGRGDFETQKGPLAKLPELMVPHYGDRPGVAGNASATGARLGRGDEDL